MNAYSKKVLTASCSTFIGEHNLFGFDALGFDVTGHTRRGFDVMGVHKETATRFDPSGFDVHHRSTTGLERQRSWWDEALDVDPQRASYDAATSQHDYELALHVTEVVLHAAALPTSSLTLAERGVLLTQLGDSVAEAAHAVVVAELGKLAPQLLRAMANESVQEHAARLRKMWDPEQFDLDTGLVQASLVRRLSGRFRVAFLPDVTIAPAELAELANAALTIACEHHLRSHRRHRHPSTLAAA